VDKDKLAQRLLATFREELAEHVGSLNEGLLSLEKDPQGPERRERLRSIFRAAHSLKGAAHAVGLKPIEAMCHRLEDVLRSVQDEVLPLGAELFETLYRAADALEDAGNRLATGRELSGGPLDELVSRLAAVGASRPRGREPDALPSVTGRPGPAATPVAPPLGAGAAEAPSPASAAPEGSVRVPAAKLETLLARTGELLVSERRLDGAEAALAAVSELLGRLRRDWRRLKSEVRAAAPNGVGKRLEGALAGVESGLRTAGTDVDRVGAALREDRRAIGRAASLVDESVRRARLLPFAEACRGLDRAVRDLAKETGKEVEIVIEGASADIDRSVLEGLKDPLLCLVRNAVDHGIEPPDRRRSAGKAELGRVRVAAALRGSRVEVTVEDDGDGVDLAGVQETARRRGLPEPRDERDCVRLLFEPGFSTAARVTEVSGRGVGLDIVRSRVEAMHGSVDFAFEQGRGTRVGLVLPLTLTAIRALIVSAGGETFAIPGTSVERLVRVELGEIRSAGGREVVPAGDGPPVPITPLWRVLGLPERRAAGGSGHVLAVLVGAPARAALAVDDLVAEREILVKDLGRRLRSLPGIAGATILETGRVALILSPAELVRTALERRGEAAFAARALPTPKKRILLADDSVTTRSLERAILEAAGYEVFTAVDGEEAWRLLLERGADLVVSDVDMPRMDGFSLCEAVRASKRFRDLPLVLVTALESAADKARGAEAGADAYIVKSSFDRRGLLETVGALLGGPP
jgi:two-component system chemotaxis sensor kinase CheA